MHYFSGYDIEHYSSGVKSGETHGSSGIRDLNFAGWNLSLHHADTVIMGGCLSSAQVAPEIVHTDVM